MALTPAQNEALIREVDDAVRQDDLINFWQGYGKLVIGAIVLGLAAFGAWLLWLNHQHAQADAAGEQLSTLIKSAQSETLNQESYDQIMASGAPAYKAAAQVVKGALASGKDNTAEADKMFSTIVADKKAPQPIRDLALVRKTALAFDKMKPQDVVATLKPLAEPGGAWFGSAGELTAIAQLKMGQNEAAGATFAAISRDNAAPPTVRLRAAQMAGTLGVASDKIGTIALPNGGAPNAQ